MWQQFWIQNTHYILEVFVGFLMVTASWIYFDGWLVERRLKTLTRALGFLMLAVWSFLDAVPLGIAGIEQLADPKKLADLSGLLGFGLLFVSLLIDPVPVKPGERPILFFSKLWEKIAPGSFAMIPPGLSFLAILRDLPAKIPSLFSRFPTSVTGIRDLLIKMPEFFRRLAILSLPVLTGIVAVLTEPKVWMFLLSVLITTFLWLHYKRGIQSEWKFFYLGFFFFSVALAFALGGVFQGTTNVLLANLLAPYQLIWIFEHGIKFVGALLLGIWAWGFIRFRIFPQIFSSFIALSFVIFLTTTIIYTGFLLNRTQESTIKNLETNVKTLDFALQKVKESAILAARIASANTQVREAVRGNEKEALFQNLNTLMFENETDFMLALNTGGEVLMRAEDKERFGDSLADDPVVWRALDGKAVVTTFTERGVTIPTVSIKASAPIVDTSETGEPEIIGAIVTGFLLDTAFVDGIKKLTDLDITVFANDTSSATTFTVPESQFRLIGTRELNQRILNTVLKEGMTYTGTASIMNRPFLAAYIPFRDIEETTVGMFFTGRSQASILAVVSDTIQLTFSISILLMILSILPLAWLARFISYHQQV